MLRRPQPALSLARRLVGRYLMFVLAGVFACVAVAMVLAVQGRLLDLSPLTAVAPLAVAVVGAMFLWRFISVHSSIADQLQRLGDSGTTDQLELLPDLDPLTRGWNILVREVLDRQTLESLDLRLTSFSGNLQSHRWEAIAGCLSDGIVACDAAGRITQINQAAVQMFRADSPAECVGRDFLERLAAAFPLEARGSLAPLREGADKRTFDLKHGKEIADGVWRTSRVPMLSDSAEPGGRLWTIRDVTQQRLAEDARSQFVNTATHELRTPLANIKALAETLAGHDQLDWEKQKEFYNIINAEATRLARFVDELLNVNQMETGALSICKNEVDLERLLHELIEHIAPQLKQKKLRFDQSCPAKFPKLRADKDKLAAALVNLLGNAIKYTPEGGWVRLKVEADENQVHFGVEDSGIGIAPEELPKMCQKFFRSGDSRVRAVTGSGLGLAFAKEVAQLHNGSLTITSELNKGSLFTLTVPLA